MRLKRRRGNNSTLFLKRKYSFRGVMRRYGAFYLFLLPALAWFAIFQYYPITGIQIAFKNYRFSTGIWGSDWVGLRYFRDFLSDPHFYNILRNSLVISFSKLFFLFPAPIILALMLNSVKNVPYRRTVQTLSYLPHFVSWVVVAALIHKFFSPTIGLINDLRIDRGLDTIYYLGRRELFLPFVVLSDMWKGIGFGSIIYLAALSGIDPNLYEAANIDGANGFRKLLHITLPGIKPTIGILFILNLGGLLANNMEQILLLQTPNTYEVSEILETFILRRGLRMNQFDYATAVGLFRSVVSLFLIVVVNKVSRKLADVSLW